MAGDLLLSHDTSRISLAQTQRSLEEDGLSAHLIIADLAHLPFRCSSLDEISSFGSFLNCRASFIEQSVREIARTLKEGGCLSATFRSVDELKHEQGKQVGGEEREIVVHSKHPGDAQLHHSYTRSELHQVLADFQMVRLELKHLEDRIPGPRGHRKYGIWSVLATKRLKQVDPDHEKSKIHAALSISQSKGEKGDLTEDLFDQNFVKTLFSGKVACFDSKKFQILDCTTIPVRLNSGNRGKFVVEFVLRLLDLENRDLLSKSIIGKCRLDGRNELAFSILRRLWENGFAIGREEEIVDGLNVCEPITFIPEWNLALTSKASGFELQKILLGKGASDGSLIEPSIALSARWLAKLHSCNKMDDVPERSREEEAGKLGEWCWHLSWLYPQFAERLSNTIRLVEEREDAVDPRSSVLIHGDFHQENIFVDGRKLTVIDFEQACISDPARDVGYFLAQLFKKNLKYNLSLNMSSLRDLFFKEYTKVMPEEILQRELVYEARTFLQHLNFYYWTMHHEPNFSDFEYWLGRAEECLLLLCK